MNDFLDKSEKRRGAIRLPRRIDKPILGHWGPAKFPDVAEDRTRKLFNITPMCEVCGAEPAISLACFDGFTNWKFCGACTSDQEFYTIPLADFFDRPASVLDWLAHMGKKQGMDWDSFGKMMLRLREATGSKGGVGPSRA
jgi:hypothetical protein